MIPLPTTQPQPVAIVPPRQESYADLVALAKELVATGFLPAAVKTPAQAVAIIMTGRELGLPPMQALRSICIIQGKPELAADLQLSLFKRAGGQAKWLSQSSEEAKLWLKHPNGDEFTQVFTMLDAKRAGLAAGVNWQKYPQAMLRSRAITAGLKSLGFEPLCGCYAPGEIGGPEVVEHYPADPAPAPEQKQTPEAQNALGASGGVSKPIQPAKTSPTHLPASSSGDKKPKPAIFADDETRKRMIAGLEAAGLLDLALEYFIKLEKPCVLLQTETLVDVPLQFVPVTRRQMELLRTRIIDFGNGAEAQHAFPPNELAPAKPTPPPAAKTGEVKPPASVEAAKKKDSEWFWDCIVSIPRKGMKKPEYDSQPDTIKSLYEAMKTGDEESQKRLWGLALNWKCEPREYNGKTYPPTDADKVTREAFDAFLNWEKENGSDDDDLPL